MVKVIQIATCEAGFESSFLEVLDAHNTEPLFYSLMNMDARNFPASLQNETFMNYNIINRATS